MTSDGTRTYEWDAENRLVAVKEGANTLASYTYDGKGRRSVSSSSGTVRTNVYADSDVVSERVSTGVTVEYFHPPAGIDEPLGKRDNLGATRFYVSDHLGSVAEITEPSGAVVTRRLYDPFGTLLSGDAERGYAFTGREWEPETSLHYYRARYYDARLGRFLSMDPAGAAGGTNPYRYVENNPLTHFDPTGRLVEVRCRLIRRP
jgi:RHS repeat-associated protein